MGLSVSFARFVMPVALLALAGCVGAPELGPRPVPLGTQDMAAERSLAVASDTDGAPADWPSRDWWQGLDDPQLASLIEEGLRRSPDVAAALARVRRASGLAREAGAPLLPQIDLRGQVTAEKQSYNMGFPREFVPKGWLDYGQIAADIGFDPDIWGRNRAALAAATSEARAATIDAEQARLMLSTGIALAYLDLARLHAERDVRRAALELRSATRSLVDDRLANGLETRGSLRQAEAGVATARADLGAAEQAIALRRHQIAALLGAGPDRGLAIAPPARMQAPTGGLPASATTELVGRRPDIAAARARMEAAARRIDAARADFFPAIRLGALVGMQSIGLGSLFDRDSTFASAGPALNLPIFRGGALKGRYTAARGAYEETVAEYDRTVIAAYQQVADAVTGREWAVERLGDARAALDASEEAYSIARLRYEGGLSNYLDVLVIEDRLLQSRLALAALETEARSLDISLIRALGGGFVADIARPAQATEQATKPKDAPDG